MSVFKDIIKEYSGESVLDTWTKPEVSVEEAQLIYNKVNNDARDKLNRAEIPLKDYSFNHQLEDGRSCEVIVEFGNVWSCYIHSPTTKEVIWQFPVTVN